MQFFGSLPSAINQWRLSRSSTQPSDYDLEYDSDDSGEGQPARARRRGPRALGSQPREELKMVLVSCRRCLLLAGLPLDVHM